MLSVRSTCAGLMLGAALASADVASASSCWPTEPICHDFWAADAVFIGRSRWLGPEPGHVAPGGMVRIVSGDELRRVRVEVIEIFRGLPGVRVGAILDIGVSVAPSMPEGETFFIYATTWKHGGLFVPGCGRTKRVSQAAEDLRYARGLAASTSTKARVFGETAWGEMQPRVLDVARQSLLPSAALIVSGEGGEVRIESDGGRFEAELRPGTYELSAEVAAGYSATAAPSTVRILDGRACQRVQVFVHLLRGRITGRIVDAEGRPVTTARVWVTPSSEGRSVQFVVFPRAVGADGSFADEDAEPGRHTLTIELSPEAPRIEREIELEPGEALDLGAIVVPRPVREPARPRSVP